MPLPNIGKTVKAGTRSTPSLWYLEWTYAGGGVPTLDATQSDVDARVATPVAAGATGFTLIRFPKCRRVRVVHMSVQANVAGAAEVNTTPSAIVPASGSMTFVMTSATSTPANPASGARGRLHLLLDY